MESLFLGRLGGRLSAVPREEVAGGKGKEEGKCEAKILYVTLSPSRGISRFVTRHRVAHIITFFFFLRTCRLFPRARIFLISSSNKIWIWRVKFVFLVGRWVFIMLLWREMPCKLLMRLEWRNKNLSNFGHIVDDIQECMGPLSRRSGVVQAPLSHLRGQPRGYVAMGAPLGWSQPLLSGGRPPTIF